MCLNECIFSVVSYSFDVVSVIFILFPAASIVIAIIFVGIEHHFMEQVICFAERQ